MENGMENEIENGRKRNGKMKRKIERKLEGNGMEIWNCDFGLAPLESEVVDDNSGPAKES